MAVLGGAVFALSSAAVEIQPIFPEDAEDYWFKGSIKSVNRLFSCMDDAQNDDFVSFISYYNEQGFLEERQLSGQELAIGFTVPLLPQQSLTQTFVDGRLTRIKAERLILGDRHVEIDTEIKSFNPQNRPTRYIQHYQYSPAKTNGEVTLSLTEVNYDDGNIILKESYKSAYGIISDRAYLTTDASGHLQKVIAESPVTRELGVRTEIIRNDQGLPLKVSVEGQQMSFEYQGDQLSAIEAHSALGILYFRSEITEAVLDECGNPTSAVVLMKWPVKDKLDELNELIIDTSSEDSPMRENPPAKPALTSCKKISMKTEYQYFHTCAHRTD